MKQLKVLIIDDVQSMRKFARFGLEKSFPNVIIDEAENGKEAQKKIETSQYDLILCDWEMPVITGYDLLTWVSGHPTAKNIPFVMVTSRNDKESVINAIKCGAVSYIVKPYTADMLAQKITTAFETFDRRRNERVDAGGTVIIHFQESVARGNINDVSMGGVFGTFSRKNVIPAIFERVLIDIKLSNDMKASGFEGFVIRLQAAEAFVDAEDIRIALKFLELSEAQQIEMVKLIDSVKNQ